ncbi:MAG TPA: hypothetical protein VK986_09440 [Tepidisphaeraceae bacterium]|nr:hypothetical protein [Tepidisphaeraceae bacterium]
MDGLPADSGSAAKPLGTGHPAESVGVAPDVTPVLLDYAGTSVPITRSPDRTPTGDAVALGFMLFVPFVTGLMAIVLAARALRRFPTLTTAERAAAILALVLGVINPPLWIWILSR